MRLRGATSSWADALVCAALAVVSLVFTAGLPRRAEAQGTASAREALGHGRYDEAEQALIALHAGTGALCPGAACDAELALAEFFLSRGRYDEAIALASTARDRVASVSSREGIAAATSLGEALAARGRLDEADAAFRSVATEPDAHRARVLLGRLLLERGRSSEARPFLTALITAYNRRVIASTDAAGLSYVGMAAALLESPHDANDAFQEATRADRTRVETQTEWARLYLGHHDVGHAEACVRDALAVNPHDAVALMLAARVVLEQSMDFTSAEARLREALAVNPSLVAAHVTSATIALRDMDLSAADAHLAAALAVNPSDREALSVFAAVRFVAGDDRAFSRAIDAVHAVSPRDTDVFSIVAEHADWEHRYEDEVALARRALAIDPTDAAALSTLGTNLLRVGEEEEGLEALNASFRRDRFDVRVFNTLNFYEDVIAPHYEWIERRPFRIRVHHDERPILERIVPPVVDEAYRALRARYRYTPRAPLFLELYASQAHFAVRTSGLPNLGVQGVCFGRVVTALSPRGGPFDWAQISWHELSHVFHLGLSRNRVPRWLTEGLAEYETSVARPEWAREDDHRLYLMIASGRLPPLSEMNHAFTHARSPQAMLDAYYASTRIAAFLVDHFGMRRVVTLLREYGRGRTTEEAFRRALSTSVAEVDRLFREAELVRLAQRSGDFAVDVLAYAELPTWATAAAANPRDARARAEHAVALLVNGESEAALAEAREAVSIDPHEPFGRFVLLELAVMRRDGPDAAAHASDLIASGHDGYAVRLAEARAAIYRGDVATARASLLRATEIDPARVDAWMALDALAEASSDAAFRRVTLAHRVSIEQHDREGLAAYLAVLEASGEHALLSGLAERVRFTDPENRESHLRIARARIALGDRAGALEELDTLAVLGGDLGPVEALRTEAEALPAARGRRRR